MTQNAKNAKTQAGRFMEAARRADADEDEAAFREKLAAIARQKPANKPPAEPPKTEKPRS